MLLSTGSEYCYEGKCEGSIAQSQGGFRSASHFHGWYELSKNTNESLENLLKTVLVVMILPEEVLMITARIIF